MSSVEIEDVLSSIRRLVSEDLRPQSRAGGLPAKTSDRLILTPALRVVSDPVVPESVAKPASVSQDGSVLAALLEQIADGTPRLTEAEDLPDPAEDAHVGASPSLEDVVAAVGARVSPEGWEAEAEDLVEDMANAGWPQAGWASPEVVEVDLDQVEEAEVLQVVAPDQSRLDEAWRDGAWPGGPLEADLDDVTGPEDSTLADLAEAAAVAEIQRASGADAPNTTTRMFDDEDQVLDEEALGDLVRDIIREELQGALGERITRNVRKLVRAEINRVLSSRELN